MNRGNTKNRIIFKFAICTVCIDLYVIDFFYKFYLQPHKVSFKNIDSENLKIYIWPERPDPGWDPIHIIKRSTSFCLVTCSWLFRKNISYESAIFHFWKKIFPGFFRVAESSLVCFLFLITF